VIASEKPATPPAMRFVIGDAFGLLFF